MFNHKWSFGFVTLALFLGFKSFALEMKIATVDMQKALQTVEAGKKAKATLEQEFNKKKAELQDEEEKIRKMSAEYQKQRQVLSDSARTKKEAEIQEKAQKYQEKFGKSQYEIQARERELTDPIISKLRAIIEEIGSQKSYTFIIEKNDNSILYSTSKEDLTDEVIKLFNKKNG